MRWTSAQTQLSGDDFERIQERGELRHTLEPGATRSAADQAKLTKKANRSVLSAYRRHLTAGGHSESIRARDLELAGWLADRVAPDRNLARLDRELVEGCVRTLERYPLPRAQFFTSLKHFVVFLGQSERMDWGEVDELHAWRRREGRKR